MNDTTNVDCVGTSTSLISNTTTKNHVDEVDATPLAASSVVLSSSLSTNNNNNNLNDESLNMTTLNASTDSGGGGGCSELLNLREILQLFNCAISQEQAWAVLYQVLTKFKVMLDTELSLVKANRDRIDINLLNFAKDGAIWFDFGKVEEREHDDDDDDDVDDESSIKTDNG